ncbi:AXL1, partial [Symbiodinium microadriaticum]
DYCLPLDLSVPDTAQHSHMPFVAILLQAIMHWREEHNGGSPVSFADKKAFVDLIKSWSRDIAEEQNYAEAVKYAPKCYAKPCLPSNVQELLEGCAMRDPVTATTSDFRIMLHALNIFITQSERHCEWPLKGSIPDMTSTSETFVDLQQIYHKKAEDDRRKFTSIVHSVLE